MHRFRSNFDRCKGQSLFQRLFRFVARRYLHLFHPSPRVLSLQLCPTLTYPYKYRAARLLKEGKPDLARAEMDRALRFMATPDLLEFRAYCSVVLQVRNLLTRNPFKCAKCLDSASLLGTVAGG